MTPSPRVGLLHHDIPLIPSSVHEEKDEARDEKEDAIHDPKSKTGFQHRTSLVDRRTKRAVAIEAIRTQTDIEISIAAEIRTIGI